MDIEGSSFLCSASECSEFFPGILPQRKFIDDYQLSGLKFYQESLYADTPKFLKECGIPFNFQERKFV